MTKPVCVAIAAFFTVVAAASCTPDSVKSQGQANVATSAATSVEPETYVPREYYGRTEFEIPGGDGQVVDFANG